MEINQTIKTPYRPQEVPDDLDLIREQLYYGAIKDIAGSTGYSENLVQRVLTGTRRNNGIVEAARQLIKDHKEALAKIEVKYNRHNQ